MSFSFRWNLLSPDNVEMFSFINHGNQRVDSDLIIKSSSMAISASFVYLCNTLIIFNSLSSRNDYKRHILTSMDVRFWRLKWFPQWQGLKLEYTTRVLICKVARQYLLTVKTKDTAFWLCTAAEGLIEDVFRDKHINSTKIFDVEICTVFLLPCG